MAKKPEIEENELDKMQKQFDKFDKEVKDLTTDRMNLAKKEEKEPQTLMSQKDIEKSKDLYLKPNRTIGSREKFNERFREDYNFQKEYVRFIAENNEVKGETITMWAKPFPGCPAEEWIVPVNKPIWAPRYVAEQIKAANYRRLKMDQQKTTSSDGMGTYYGSIVAEATVQRLDALPVSTRKSIFMGAND